MDEKEYIGKEAFNYAIREAVKKYPNSFYNGLEVARQIAHDFPAADVRPVVRCGECKHWFENGTDYCSCDRDALLRERDFFCAAGEKREES